MELVWIATGAILPHRLQKRGRIYTYNQSVVKQLTTHPRMCRSGQRSRVFFALSAWEILQEGQISLTWHRGHPERREKNKSLWSRDDWGSFLANLYAPPRADPSPASTPIPIMQTIYTDLVC